MIDRAISAGKRMLGMYCPRRDLVILPDDVFLVSFPKSGNTWSRFLVANLVYPDQQVSFANLYLLVPDPVRTYKKDFDRMRRPRVIKSHEAYDPRYPRVIYIVRDPRDVVLSQYHYHRKLRKIEDNYPLEKFVSRFLEGKTCPHGSWGQNVASWLTTRQSNSQFLLLRYEDMLSNTVTELGKIATFLQLQITDEQLAQAVERSSVQEMRKLEKAQSEDSMLTKGSRQDLSFVRGAGSGGWRTELRADLVEKIEAAWGPLMNYLGYPLASQAYPKAAAAGITESLLNGVPR